MFNVVKEYQYSVFMSEECVKLVKCVHINYEFFIHVFKKSIGTDLNINI
jgi:hypothetical protein